MYMYIAPTTTFYIWLKKTIEDAASLYKICLPGYIPKHGGATTSLASPAQMCQFLGGLRHLSPGGC